jgi:hypothetical protein
VTNFIAVHIGEIIRQWREGGDDPMTRDAVALRTGRCVSTIRNWEAGRDPRVFDLIDLEKAKPGLVELVFNAALQKQLRRRRRKHTNGDAAER